MRSVQLAFVVLLILGCLPPVFADGYFDQGVRLYQKQDYKTACTYFEQAIKTSGQAQAYYYAAVCWHQMKQYKLAEERYRSIVELFPDTDAAKQATVALQTLNPQYARELAVKAKEAARTALMNKPVDVKTMMSTLSKANEMDLSRVPQKFKLYYRPRENSGTAFIVDTTVNNRPLEMLFDTGASTTVVGKNHLKALGIKPPGENERPTGYSIGVGSSKPSATWQLPVTLKVGDAIIPNFSLTVMEQLNGEPLLGQNFFKNFAYTVDYGARSITLSRAAPTTAQMAYGASVPFVREGNELVVEVEVNGKPYKMFFDTGATMMAFSMQDMLKLGIQIPEDAHQGMSHGIGGATTTFTFPIKRMRMGPIEKRDIMVGVVMQQGMQRPLIGQNFYEGWQYTIDNVNNKINFLRR